MYHCRALIHFIWHLRKDICFTFWEMALFHFLFSGLSLTPGNSTLNLNGSSQKTSSGDSEIVQLLAGRNMNLQWADQYTLHYQQDQLVISLAEAVRGTGSSTAPVPDDLPSRHLPRCKSHSVRVTAHGVQYSCMRYLLFSLLACPLSTKFC